MNLSHIQDRLALKDLVDTFSNLADEKKVAEQMSLFTPDAVVNTYIGGKLVFAMRGVGEIEQVFSNFLAPFEQVYHLNGQHSVTLIDEENATAIHYCLVKLVEQKEGKIHLQEHSVRYTDTYRKQNGKWLICHRLANFMVSENRIIG